MPSPIRRLRLSIIVILFGSFVLWSSTGAAAPAGGKSAKPSVDKQARKEAKALYQRGIAAYEKGNLKAAYEAFSEAYERSPEPIVLYNLGAIAADLDKYPEAVEALTGYLESEPNVDSQRVAAVRLRLERLNRKVGRLWVKSSTKDAKFEVAGASYPPDHKVVLLPGTYDVVVSAPDHRTERRTVVVNAEGTARLVVELSVLEPDAEDEAASALRPGRAAGGGQDPMADSAAGSRRAGRLRGAAIGTAVAGGLVGAAAIGTGVVSLQAGREVEQELGALPSDPQSVRSSRDRARALGITTDVLIVSASALVVSSIVVGVIYLRGRNKSRSSALARALGISWPAQRSWVGSR
ncbi:MAG: hypothetical protein AAGF11_15030 [Myxococcota bacterium]